MSAISIVNAKKNYGSLQALKGINLEVKKGEFFGLLGPNGAGKTTLIHSIVGLCKLKQGSIAVYGHDVQREARKAHALVGFSPQDVNLDRFFPIQKILEFQAGFFGVSPKKRKQLVEKLLHQFHLEEKAGQPYYKLSGGMQKRLLVAKAMVGNPRVLILDEPTAGVDVEQRHEFWEYLRALNKKETTIILTTHYIDEAEALCERIGIIHLGKICEMGTPPALIDKYCEKKMVITASQSLKRDDFKDLGFHIEIEGSHLCAWGADVGTMLEKIQKKLATLPQHRVVDLHVERGTLEDVFLKVTGSKMENKSI